MVSDLDLKKQLRALLDLPAQTVWFEIRVAVNEPVTIVCGYRPDRDKLMAGAELIVQTFELKPRAQTSVPTPGSLTYG